MQLKQNNEDYKKQIKTGEANNHEKTLLYGPINSIFV